MENYTGTWTKKQEKLQLIKAHMNKIFYDQMHYSIDYDQDSADGESRSKSSGDKGPAAVWNTGTDSFPSRHQNGGNQSQYDGGDDINSCTAVGNLYVSHRSGRKTWNIFFCIWFIY